MDNFDGDLAENLKLLVDYLAVKIGERSYSNRKALKKTEAFITKIFTHHGYQVKFQKFTADNNTYKNIFVEIPGQVQPEKIVVIGAHYDTVEGTPGADDNASAVAALLELAGLLKGFKPACTIHLVAFVLEEPPFFFTEKMGSYVYAENLSKNRCSVAGMVCLEMLGYYSDEPNSQDYPLDELAAVYPDKGNFIALISNADSADFLKRFFTHFKKGTDIPAYSLAAPENMQGMDFSDHHSFWLFGYPALMISDTAFFRNKNYHEPTDTPEKLDFGKMSKVVKGIVSGIKGITQ